MITPELAKRFLKDRYDIGKAIWQEIANLIESQAREIEDMKKADRDEIFTLQAEHTSLTHELFELKAENESLKLQLHEARKRNVEMNNELGACKGERAMFAAKNESLVKALEVRNEIEGKAHALFTSPLNGYTFAHLPQQCDPLGFVMVLRAAIKHLLEGKPLPKPFILFPEDETDLPT